MNRIMVKTAVATLGAVAVLVSTGWPATAAPPAVAAQSPAGQSSRAGTASISISSNMRFSKANVTSGGSVLVTNFDSQTHTVTADDGSFNVRVRAGKSRTFTAPNTVGTYKFHCTIHPDMRGKLKVTP